MRLIYAVFAAVLAIASFFYSTISSFVGAASRGFFSTPRSIFETRGAGLA